MSDKALDAMLKENLRLISDKTALLKRIAELEAATPPAVSAEPNGYVFVNRAGARSWQEKMPGPWAHSIQPFWLATPTAGEQARDAVLEECLAEINKWIKPGEMQGNGCDDQAQRNGMILAANIVHQMRYPAAMKAKP